jgi:serine/threonine protein kinase
MPTSDETRSLNSGSHEARLDALLAQYVEAVEAGGSPDRQALLDQNPDLAADLREFFANRDEIQQAVGDVRQRPAGALPRLRYFGDYELLEEIARGGMGIVYKARQVSLNRIVAVKMIRSGEFASPAELERFLAEAKAAANLDHPGIVPVYEVGQRQGQRYYSMGYVDGPSLAVRLAEGPLPPREAAALMIEVCQAVQYAHDRGVIHRDLKPGNILLSPDRGMRTADETASEAVRLPHSSLGTPKITDFGLAKRVTGDSSITQTGQILGTPSFMPPEQAAARLDLVGLASDVYALGAILYNALTGRPPFQAANAVETLKQVVESEPVGPRQLNPHIPRDLETIALKCLEKTPQRRYATVQDLADELRRFVTGQPILARPVSQAERVWRWCRRNPLVASTSGGGHDLDLGLCSRGEAAR